MNKEQQKKSAAEEAVKYVEDGMILGLGTGSTVYYFLQKLSKEISKGSIKNILGIPTSNQTEQLALKLNIPLTTLNEYPAIDLVIDGADEVDENLNLIKGGGGALLREKIVAQASKKFVVVIDESKLSKSLGEKFYLPVEVLPLAIQTEKSYLESMSINVSLRKNVAGDMFITDQGNFILDVNFGTINNPLELEALLNKRAGIIEHGLFINMAEIVICAGNGGITIFNNKSSQL